DSLLVEELGDLLLQVVFHAQLGAEEGRFTFAEVAAGVSEKMVRRHPHVFGSSHCDTSDEVLDAWAEIKSEEKAEKGSKERLLDIPKAFPALYRSQKIQKKAAEVGFDWDKDEEVRAKVLEEVEEFSAALQGQGDPKEELGDILFAVVNWSRFNHIDAEEALREANEKFIRRFYAMEDKIATDKKSLAAMDLEEMNSYWEAVKKEQKKQKEQKEQNK
ncbi:MAG: nucleoside triphosphate pyrophosphohydrolase, partial [Bacillota bacterium]|nr:nucleoside triphosphate pyrophosphohydrolase [Bacillota bacterium]